MKAIIGISLGFIENDEEIIGIKNSYVEAVKKAGGIPVLIPPLVNKDEINNLLEKVDGILISGGCDVDPHFFREEPEADMRRIDPHRDKFEMELIQLALKYNKPLLAICRGIQVLNIVCGGTIVQNLDHNHLKHEQQAPSWYATHSVCIKKDSLLYEIFRKKTIRVNSFHHQGLDKIGHDLIVTSKSSDNLVEGVIKKDHPFAVGIQWHPERMINEYPEQLRLFQALIEKSSNIK